MGGGNTYAADQELEEAGGFKAEEVGDGLSECGGVGIRCSN